MICLKRCACYATLIGMASVTAAYADGVTAINSAVVTTHAFNDVPTSTPIVFNSYPSFILTAEENVSAPTGFANRDTWQFSANGTTPFQIGPKDYFLASMTLTLTGTPITPRKEAGWLFSTGSNGDIQFILDTDGHEVVQFGGISFYSFTGSSVILRPISRVRPLRWGSSISRTRARVPMRCSSSRTRTRARFLILPRASAAGRWISAKAARWAAISRSSTTRPTRRIAVPRCSIKSASFRPRNLPKLPCWARACCPA